MGDIDHEAYTAWQRHTDRVLPHTVLRHLDHTRGRLGPSIVMAGASEDSRRRLVAQSRMVLNGDCRVRRCHVVLTDELRRLCGDGPDAMDKLKEMFFPGLGRLERARQRTVAQQRPLGSMTESAVKFSVGGLVHGVYSRVFRRAFPDWMSGALPEAEVTTCRSIPRQGGPQPRSNLCPWFSKRPPSPHTMCFRHRVDMNRDY